MKRIALVIAGAFVVVALMIITRSFANADSLPQTQFLGEGTGTYNTTLDNFIVKRTSPFRFVWQPGPTYESDSMTERVWAVRGASQSPPELWHQEVDLGQVEEGCIARYTGIDDDVDNRINYFELDGERIETVIQGMDFEGSFIIPKDGDLVFIANDSVGGWFSPCDEKVTPTPTETLPPTETPTPTATGTATPGPSPTPSTPEPSPTPENTAVPPTPQPTVTATKRPRENSCVRINFEVSGQSAARGLYIVQETGGKELASWYALDGWQDSGWFKDIDITHENVFVKVLYYRGPDADPIEMTILNPAPGTPYGWMSWGICHALEVAWPGEKPEGAMVPDETGQQGTEQAEQTTSEQSAPPPPPPPTEEPEENSTMGASLNG